MSGEYLRGYAKGRRQGYKEGLYAGKKKAMRIWQQYDKEVKEAFDRWEDSDGEVERRLASDKQS